MYDNCFPYTLSEYYFLDLSSQMFVAITVGVSIADNISIFLTVHMSYSVFVLYATSCANTVAQKNKRKTLTAPDVFTAMEEMEFETFLEPLKDSLEVHFHINLFIITTQGQLSVR